MEDATWRCDDGLLVAEMVHDHATLAATRIVLRCTICKTLSDTLRATSAIDVAWRNVRATRCAWRAWNAAMRRRRPARPRVASWVRRRRITDETPVMLF